MLGRSLRPLCALAAPGHNGAIAVRSGLSLRALTSLARSGTGCLAPRFAASRPLILTARHLATNATGSDAAAKGASAASDAAAGKAEASAATEKEAPGAEEGKQQGAQEEVFEEEIQYEDEPLMAKLSRFVWTSIKVAFGGGIIVLIFYAGWTIVTTLAPSGASANAIMRKASDILKHEPELVTYFGDIKTYGEDFGGSREGRRYFVPDYEYKDDLTDVPYRRVRFNLEGERGRKGTVWAELRAGTSDFRYLIVMSKDHSRVWSVVDHRPPERTLSERQAAVTTLLQDAGWSYWADNEVDMGEQARQLGDYWLKVRTVRCDLDKERCEKDGVSGTPAWSTGPAASPSVLSRVGGVISEWTGVGGSGSTGAPVGAADAKWRLVKGVKTLRELEVMTKELHKSKVGAGAGGSGVFDSVKRAVGMA